MPNKYLDSVGLAEYTTLIKTALDDKADLASPALTGTPTAPTPTAGDDSTKIATTEFVNNYLPLSGGTMTGQLVINRGNGVAGGGIQLTGSGQNFAISVKDTSVTKGTAPSSNKYWGIDFYGSDTDNYNKRIGMLETTLDSNNVATTAIRAYNCTTNTNTGNCSITVNVDGSGNAYTSAPTPAAGDNSTKIATTAFVNTKASDYLPLSGGSMTGNIRSASSDMFVLRKENTSYGIQLWGGSSYNTGASISLYGKDNSNSGAFNIGTYDGNSSKILHGEPNGALTWNTWSVMEQAYAVQLGNTETHTFHMQTNLAIIFAKRGNNASIYMVDTWDTTPVRMSLSGTDPITITKGSNNNITIKNVNGSAVVLKILNGGLL